MTSNVTELSGLLIILNLRILKRNWKEWKLMGDNGKDINKEINNTPPPEAGERLLHYARTLS